MNAPPTPNPPVATVPGKILATIGVLCAAASVGTALLMHNSDVGLLISNVGVGAASAAYIWG